MGSRLASFPPSGQWERVRWNPCFGDLRLYIIQGRRLTLAAWRGLCTCLERAIALLRESKQLCRNHGIEFDGQDILEEYLAEKRATQKA